MKRAILGMLLTALALRLAVIAGAGETLAAWMQGAAAENPAQVETTSAPAPAPAPSSEAPVLLPEFRLPEAAAEEAVSLGELPPEETEAPAPASLPAVHDSSGLGVDVEALAAEALTLRLPSDGPQVLILHTHSSEAYSPDGYDVYEASDPYRTEDKSQSVIRVGDALASVLEESGLTVLHDREIYDYPSYTGSYTRSGEAASRYLAAYPSLRVVIDLHRDAIGSGDVVYRTRALLDGKTSAQVMLLIGTGANGLSHPDWRENLKLGLYLQRSAETACPGLMRPLEIVPERYNQQLCTGSMILEVGSTGNTLREAIRAAEHFGRSVGPALAALME